MFWCSRWRDYERPSYEKTYGNLNVVWCLMMPYDCIFEKRVWRQFWSKSFHCDQTLSVAFLSFCGAVVDRPFEPINKLIFHSPVYIVVVSTFLNYDNALKLGGKMVVSLCLFYFNLFFVFFFNFNITVFFWIFQVFFFEKVNKIFFRISI